jgi:hypothetical protein
MKIISEFIYFIFPLFFAGLIHHFVIIKYNLFSFLTKPIDGNKYINGKPLLGKSKTWRGLVLVPILSSVGSVIISHIIPISITLNPIWVGLLLGFGYAIAELPNSFIKRQLNIQAGQKASNKFRIFFLIFDQIDSVIGAIVVMLLIYKSSILLFLSILILGSLLHLIVDFCLYKYGYKKSRNNQ